MRTRTEKYFLATISSVSHEGKGIAYVDDKTIFIDNALLNEEVEYKIIKKKKNLVFAKSLKVCLKVRPKRLKTLLNPSKRLKRPVSNVWTNF